MLSLVDGFFGTLVAIIGGIWLMKATVILMTVLTVILGALIGWWIVKLILVLCTIALLALAIFALVPKKKN